jgi:hypothetical protein
MPRGNSNSPKLYRIERRRPRGLVFVCVACGHAVDVAGYQHGAIVNPRTRAAAAITAHALQEHPQVHVYNERNT